MFGLFGLGEIQVKLVTLLDLTEKVGVGNAHVKVGCRRPSCKSVVLVAAILGIKPLMAALW